MFSAIAHDGVRDVVVGVGPTEDLAKSDAKFLLDSMRSLSHPLEIKKVVEITESQADLFRRGMVDCLRLGIPDSV